MTESIKLTDYIVKEIDDLNHCLGTTVDPGTLLTFRLKRCNEEDGNTIQKQILENQKIVNNIKERIQWLESFGKNVFSDKYIKDVTAELENIM